MTARRVVGLLLVAVGMSYAGWSAAGVTPKTTPAERTTTHLVVKHRTRLVTIHVKGHILRRHDHILVVYVPRTTFRNHTTRKRIVVPAHVVRIREPMPVFGVTSAAVIGVAPPAATVYVPVTVTVPGPTQTVTEQAPTTITQVATSTVTVTVTVPLGDTGGTP